MNRSETKPAANRPGPHPPRRPARPIRWGLAACCLLLSGCGNPADPGSPTTTTDDPAAPTAAVEAQPATPGATPPFGFRSDSVATGDVVWTVATDPATGAPVAPVARFAPDAPTIVAAVPIERAPAGTRLRAEWRYNDAPLDGLSSEVVVDGDGMGRWVSFSIDLPEGEPWPAGTYEVVIAIDDHPALRAAVEVSDGGG